MPSIAFDEDNATLPAIVDNRALTEPDRLYGATTWIEGDGKVECRSLTYRDVSETVNRCAEWLHKRFGKSTDFTTLAYAGSNDYRYLFVTMAAAKLGFKALLLAPWNQTVSQIKLLDECNCSIFLAAEDDPKVRASVDEISKAKDVQVHSFPTLKALLDGEGNPHWPFEKTLEEVRQEDYVVIHTSGSTGHPKSMVYKYGAMAALKWLARPKDLLPDGPTSNIKEVWSNQCHLMALPPCHMGGVLGLGPFNVYWNMPMILAPGDRPITPEIAAQIFEQDICDAAFIPPAYLQVLSRDAERLESIRRLKHVLWVGAPFTSSDVADAIRSRARIEPAYGSSEAGPFAFVLEHQDDYAWTHFHDVMGWQMQHFSDDLYELVLMRDPKLENAQFIFQNFPHLSEWRTKDLWSRHPERSDLWRFRGRTDDILLLGNARSVDPNLMETAVAKHPKVKAALLCAHHIKAKTALLVEAAEPPTNTAESDALTDELWPNIEEGNSLISAAGTVDRSRIVYASGDKPFKRAGKGSVQRAMTVKDYAPELERVYELEASNGHGDSQVKAQDNCPNHRFLWLPAKGSTFLAQHPNSQPELPYTPNHSLTPGHSLVRVSFSGINPADLKHRSLGSHTTVPGYDFSGHITHTTPGSPFQLGDPVGGHAPAGLHRLAEHGAHQDLVVAVNDMLFAADRLPLPDAAGLSTPLRTAIVALHTKLRVPLPWAPLPRDSEGIIVWGGGTQVGAWAVQLASQAGLAPVFVVAAAGHHASLAEMGASECFDYRGPGGEARAVGEMVGAARKAGATIRRGIDAVGWGRGDGVHRAERVVDVLEQLAEGAEWHATSVEAGAPRDVTIIHAQPDRDVEWEIAGQRVALPREEQEGEMMLQMIEHVAQNYGKPFRVPGSIRVVPWEQGPDELLTVAQGSGPEGLRKVIVRH